MTTYCERDEDKKAMSNCCNEKPEVPNVSEAIRESEAVSRSACCEVEQVDKPLVVPGCCDTDDAEGSKKPDYLLWASAAIVLAGYLIYLGFSDSAFLPQWLAVMSSSMFELVNTMWWGIVAAIVFVGLLERIPKSLVMSALGKGGTVRGIFRATIAGVLLDLCNHGILMVGTKLYERGASIGQVMAFLIASPWNSLSLTIILVALVGLGWTLAFIALSMVVGVVTGLIFDRLVARGTLPVSRHQQEAVEPQKLLPGIKALFASAEFTPSAIGRVLRDGLKDSRMVFRWLFFGLVLAASIRAFVPMDTYQSLFGPTLAGLLLTTFFATIIEVCSEGSTPIAADLPVRQLLEMALRF